MVRFLKGKRVALQMQQIIPAMLQHEILADILLLESGFQKTAIRTGSGWQQWHRTENLFSSIKECSRR